MTRSGVALALACTVGLAGCADADAPASSLPAAVVTASGETQPVGTAAADAADDPAIWHNPDDPAASLIVATDKKAGLYVYGLDGKVRDFDRGGRLNNVDLADMGEAGIIVAASDRNEPAHARLKLYRLDTGAAKLVPLGEVEAGTGEAYGLCLWAGGDGLHAYSVLKDGTVEEYRLELGDLPRSVHLLTRKLASQAEGCVVDPRDGTFYVGEEDVGIWKFAAGSAEGTLVAKADGQHLVADVEGLALMPKGETGGWLIASSQGDSAYALYSLPDLAFAGRFRIGAGRFGATEETDGIAVAGGSFGTAYPEGLFVAQDGKNAPDAQNFKLVSWAAILKALAQQ